MTKTESKMTGLFDQAVQSFGEAMKAGVRIQEDVAKWWTDAIDQAAPMQQWQKRSRAIMCDVLPTAQKNTEEWMRLVEQNYKKSMELLKKAFSSEETNTAAEMQARLQELWEESLDVIRENAQAMTQANAKMMELWADILRKNMNGSEVAGQPKSVAAAAK